MIPKFLQKKIRRLKRLQRNKHVALLAVIVVVSLGAIFYDVYMHNRRPNIDPTSAAPLLSVIGQAESKGNYNAYYGNPGNDSVKFTHMTIAEVMHWQAESVKHGSPSSAVGKYQIIDSTLAGLVAQLNISKHQKFDGPTQDQLAIALIERRGATDYVNQDMTREQFAHNLAKEWAGLPKVIGENPDTSYYAGDGLNKSRVSVDQVMDAIEPIKAQ